MMQRSVILQLFFYSLAFGLIVNGVLVLLSHARALYSWSHVLSVPAVTDLVHCCRELCSQEEPGGATNISNYAEIAKQLPSIDPSYRSTMVRLGSDLNFDLDRCPPGSYMLQKRKKKNFTPEHFNCPTLFLVGARKGGTSSLYHYLSNHPDFEGTRLDVGPKVGETYFFSALYERNTWEQYTGLFPSGGYMTGDASVGNLVHSLAPKRIFDACGKQAKIVMLFRDPITRLQSNFLMRARRNAARVSLQTSIATIVKLELDRFFQEAFKRTMNVNNLPGDWGNLVGLFDPAASMVYEGMYYVHMLNWLCNFPAENILVMNSEEFFRNTSKILDIVVQFLGLKRLDQETYDWITTATYNRGKYSVPYYQKLSHTDVVTLLGAYRPFNRELLKLLDWKKSNWTGE